MADTTGREMPYGMFMDTCVTNRPTENIWSVRLGKSGLKVSRVILGCMSYGDKNWEGWVLEEEEAIQHIKFAWVFLVTPVFDFG